eukprot:gene27918-36779_t
MPRLPGPSYRLPMKVVTMLKSLKIPRKLALSFLTICVSAAVMMLVFFTTVTMLRGSTASNRLSQTIHANALTLETALLRQNSQFRGFLVTADPTYLKSYGEARDEYDSTSESLEKLLTDPAQRAAVIKSREATLAWREKWGDRLIKLVQAGQRDAAQAEVRNAGKAVLTSAAVLPLRDVRDAQEELTRKNSALQETAISTAIMALLIGGIALIGIAITLAAVPIGKDLIRTAISAMHTDEQLDKIADAMAYARSADRKVAAASAHVGKARVAASRSSRATSVSSVNTRRNVSFHAARSFVRTATQPPPSAFSRSTGRSLHTHGTPNQSDSSNTRRNVSFHPAQ